MDKKNIAVSIIVPVYNGEKHLRQCIESICTQTLQSIELIFINDGSSDGSGDILREYERAYTKNKSQQKNIIVVHQKNQGRMKAREIGLSHANGEFIGFVDCDDYVSEPMFYDLYHSAVSHKADIVSCGFINVHEDGSIIQKQIFSHAFDEVKTYKILADNPPVLWNNIFHRTLFEKNDIVFSSLERGEDLAIVPCLFHYAKKTIMLEETYYYYRNINEQNTSPEKTSRYPINLLKDLEHMQDLFEAGNILASFYKDKHCSASDLIPNTLKFPDFFNRYNFKFVKMFFHTHKKWEWYMHSLLQFITTHKPYYTEMKLHLKDENKIVIQCFEQVFKIEDERHIKEIINDEHTLQGLITKFINLMQGALKKELYRRIIKKLFRS